MKRNKKYIYRQSGFTLIELLTVIAIIGILSSIVYVSLSQFRLKSKDTVVKSQLSGMRVQAELYFGINNNSYAGLCTANSSDRRGFGGDLGLLKATKEATAILSTIITNGTGSWDKVTCNDSVNAWAVEAPLSTSASGSGNSVMFCVDSRTITPPEKDTTPLGTGAIVCN